MPIKRSLDVSVNPIEFPCRLLAFPPFVVLDVSVYGPNKNRLINLRRTNESII